MRRSWLVLFGCGILLIDYYKSIPEHLFIVLIIVGVGMLLEYQLFNLFFAQQDKLAALELEISDVKHELKKQKDPLREFHQPLREYE